MIKQIEGKERNVSAVSIKDQARKIIDGLPDTATWEDVIYRLYVREAIEAGIADADAGRVVDVSEIRAEYGLPS
jgi:predicted transcriptional regulator